MTAGEQTAVIVHSSLPSLKVKGTSCQYNVVTVAGNVATLQYGDSPTATALPSTQDQALFTNAATGDLCLYSDGTASHRAVVTDISEEYADVWLVDKGVAVVCDPSELFTIPKDFCSEPPAVFTVNIKGVHSLTAGNSITGKVVAVDGGLELQLEE